MIIYSTPMSLKEASRITEALRAQGYFVEYPFQVVDLADPEHPVYTDGPDGWVFNVYTNDDLVGDWIGNTPSTPFRVAA